MQMRALGTSGLELTTVGIGTWAIGGGDWSFGWGDQDEREAIDGILKGLELGVNWIDTAAIYGDGASEELVGRALKEVPQGER
ncbi:MAG: aldo/keto reductase, partial [Akkermansiaceae bacterium]|nr:aldo/keto reductase [Akkermansiaceae bacterium]